MSGALRASLADLVLAGAALIAAIVTLTGAPAGAAEAARPAEAADLGGDLRFGVFIYEQPFATGDARRLVDAGGDVLRTTLLWFEVQQEPGADFDWTHYDGLVERSARGGVSLLPVLIGSPTFAAEEPSEPPADARGMRGYLDYVSAAVERYGRGGRFWAENPDVPYRPVEAWEVWNEPNAPHFWSAGEPSAREYARLHMRAHAAIEAVDPSARVVLGGLAGEPDSAGPGGSRRVPMGDYLERLYSVAGMRETVDVVAIHPFAESTSGVTRQIEQVRETMVAAGDAAKPIWITELGWATDGHSESELVTDPVGQAARLASTFELLGRRAERYGLELLIWFRWRDTAACETRRDCWIDHAGLFTRADTAKPSWRAFGASAGERRLELPLATALFLRLTKGI